MKDRFSLQMILTSVLLLVLAAGTINGSDETALPQRKSPRPETTSAVPHKQIGVQRVDRIHRELMRRTFSIPGLERGSSFTPYPGAVGIHLSRELRPARPRALLAGREFSHFHPDGSLHLPLPPARARQAVQSGWAVRHPWADSRKGWEGLVLVFTPQTKAELEVVFGLIVDSYNFVSGKNIKAARYRR